MRPGGRSEAVPLYATERNPQRETKGRRLANVSAKMGKPFMPWQRDLADIAGEIDPETGGPWYTEIVVVVLRQTGKTTFVRAKGAESCIYHPGSTTRYTAQNRIMALQRLETDFWQPLAESPLGAFLNQSVGRRAKKPGFNQKTGQEHIAFANGSAWWIDSVKATSGHGPTLDLGLIDEAFAHPDARVEQAMTPAMATVPHAQLYVASAAGDENSLYLRAKVEAARARVTAEQLKPLHLRRSRILYVEYAAPAGADRADPATWWACHPALGYTIPEWKVAAALESFENEPEEFDRAYLGWWPKRNKKLAVIPEAAWQADVVTDLEHTFLGNLVWGIDISPERDYASIGMAGKGLVGRVFVEHIERRQGTGWLSSRMRQLRERHGGNIVALDPGTASDSLISDLEDDGFDVKQCAGRHKIQACGGFYDDALLSGPPPQLTHTNDGELNAAVEDAQKLRGSGENGFVWSRGKSFADITPLYAVTFARWAFVEFAADDYDIEDSIA